MRCRPLLLSLCLALLAFSGTGFKQPLTWGPPSFGDNVRTIDVPVGGGDWYGISTNSDCLVRMPDVPVRARVKIDGCHDIRLVGGEFHSDAEPCSAAANGRNESAALYLNGWTGVAHVEGVKITGPGFSDGIWMTSGRPGAVGQVEGSWIGHLAACEEPQTGYPNGWPAEHPDCFQTWEGPEVLRFDKNTCFAIYEGFNVDTNSLADSQGVKHPARLIDIRRTNVRLDERVPNGRSCYAAYSYFDPSPTHTDEAYCTVGSSGYVPVYPGPTVDPTWWSGVLSGHTPGYDEIDPGEAGLGYTRPVAAPAQSPPGSTPGGGNGTGGSGALLPGSTFHLRRALRYGLVTHATCVRHCRAVARLWLASRDARRFGLGRKRAVVARGTLRAHGAGKHRIAIVFGRRARAHLRRARRLGLTVSVSVRERGAKRRVLGRRILLVRRGA